MMMKFNKKELRKYRDYLLSGEWKKYGKFDMKHWWSGYGSKESCGCLGGHYIRKFKVKNFRENLVELDGSLISVDGIIYYSFFYGEMVYGHLFDFLFSGDWKNYDNTVEGAIGRIDAVLDGSFT